MKVDVFFCFFCVCTYVFMVYVQLCLVSLAVLLSCSLSMLSMPPLLWVSSTMYWVYQVNSSLVFADVRYLNCCINVLHIAVFLIQLRTVCMKTTVIQSVEAKHNTIHAHCLLCRLSFISTSFPLGPDEMCCTNGEWPNTCNVFFILTDCLAKLSGLHVYPVFNVPIQHPVITIDCWSALHHVHCGCDLLVVHLT